MYDLVHDLAILAAQPECSMLNFDKANEPKEKETISRFLGKLNNIRTISFLNSDVGLKNYTFFITCLLKFKYMRVLGLHNLSSEELPNSILNLKHLKYLDLMGNYNIKKLPNSIWKLHQLQILHLGQCDFPHKEREVGILCFNSLMILCIMGCHLESLMEGMQSFTALRTLMIVKSPCLSSLPRHLLALKNLIITYCESLDLGNRNGDREDNIQGFGSLRNFFISRLPKLEILPMWILQCENFRALLKEEESLSLTSLNALGMGHLTGLTQLKIKDCLQLSSFLEKMFHFPALTHLTIENYPALAEGCELGIGEDWNKIAHLQDIYLDGERIGSTLHNQVTKSGLDEAATRTSVVHQLYFISLFVGNWNAYLVVGLWSSFDSIL
ncbi:hypothetical protein PVL29_018479 [Vitis rotundifolia]|uniref:Disease resistance R13L4/SHOC-2-like LRR domain-containing protein n=1 Tax=Vitis rotundifolia TaxID=103349 RepID=A0AA38Z5F6_VITRO|nr:hypothetical protein PVL29_018479 [Vitis rotundifolia]